MPEAFNTAPNLDFADAVQSVIVLVRDADGRTA